MSLRPAHSKFFVERTEAKSESNGIVIPDVAIEKPASGRVIAVAEYRLDDGIKNQMQVKVGDVVAFGKFSGTEFTYNGQRILVLHDDDVIAIE